MNSDIESYNYTQRFQEGFDGTSIQNITYTINRWKAGIEKEWEYIKKDSCEKLGGITKQTNKQNREDSLYLKKLERI